MFVKRTRPRATATAWQAIMSKATDASDVDTSVTTEEPSATTEPPVEGCGTARAIAVKDTSHTDAPYGTDRATVRAISSKAEGHDATAITNIEMARFGVLLQVKFRGTVTLSYNDVRRAINTDVYEIQNFLSHASGTVTVMLKTP